MSPSVTVSHSRVSSSVRVSAKIQNSPSLKTHGNEDDFRNSLVERRADGEQVLDEDEETDEDQEETNRGRAAVAARSPFKGAG